MRYEAEEVAHVLGKATVVQGSTSPPFIFLIFLFLSLLYLIILQIYAVFLRYITPHQNPLFLSFYLGDFLKLLLLDYVQFQGYGQYTRVIFTLNIPSDDKYPITFRFISEYVPTSFPYSSKLPSFPPPSSSISQFYPSTLL